MLLQINPKKTTPANTISTHRHILTIVILGQTTQIFTENKTKKAAPEGYFVWFHATMLFSGLFSRLLLICGLLICGLFSGLFSGLFCGLFSGGLFCGLLLNLLANEFQGDTFTVHDSGCKGFRAVQVAVFFYIPDNIALLVLRSNVGDKGQNHCLSNS